MFSFTRKTPEQLSEELFPAIHENNIEKIKQLLTPNSDGICASLKTFSTGNAKRTPLMFAAYRGRTEIIDCFLPYLSKEDINFQRPTSGRTALHDAAEAGHVHVIKQLIEAGAMVDTEDSDHYTPLLFACVKGKEDVASYLLTHSYYQQPNHEISQQDKSISLYMAARMGYPNIVELLAKNGANINIVHPEGQDTPLIIAAYHGQIEAMQCLLKLGAKVNEQNIDRNTALHFATARSPSLIIPLLEYGADLTIKNKKNNTPLDLATAENAKPLIAQHLAANNALWMAAKDRTDNVQAIQSSLKKGAYLDAPDPQGDTPIVLACRAGNINIVKMLFEIGAKMTGPAEYLLFAAIESNHADLVRFLINEKKFLLDKLSPDGLPIFYHAIRSNAGAIVNLLMHEINIDTNILPRSQLPILLYTAHCGSIPMMQTILHCAFTRNITDKQSNTVLHHGARNLTQHFFSVLVEEKIFDSVSIDSINADNFTPLMCAADAGNTEAVKLLIMNGASIEPRDSFGNDALSIATQKKQKDIIKILVYEHLKRSTRYTLDALIYMLADAQLTKKDMCDYVILLAREAGNHNTQDQLDILLEAAKKSDSLLSQYMQTPPPIGSLGDPIAQLMIELQRIYASNAYKDMNLRQHLPIEEQCNPPPVKKIYALPYWEDIDSLENETSHRRDYVLPVIQHYSAIPQYAAPSLTEVVASAPPPEPISEEISENEAKQAAGKLMTYIYQQQKRLSVMEQGLTGFLSFKK